MVKTTAKSDKTPGAGAQDALSEGEDKTPGAGAQDALGGGARRIRRGRIQGPKSTLRLHLDSWDDGDRFERLD